MFVCIECSCCVCDCSELAIRWAIDHSTLTAGDDVTLLTVYHPQPFVTLGVMEVSTECVLFIVVVAVARAFILLTESRDFVSSSWRFAWERAPPLLS